MKFLSSTRTPSQTIYRFKDADCVANDVLYKIINRHLQICILVGKYTIEQ